MLRTNILSLTMTYIINKRQKQELEVEATKNWLVAVQSLRPASLQGHLPNYEINFIYSAKLSVFYNICVSVCVGVGVCMYIYLVL